MPDQKPTTPRVFLCRHGETEWSKTGRHTGTTDVVLTPHGSAQVLATGKLIIGAGKLVEPSKLSHIYVSPRKRAQQTAGLLLEALGSGTEVDGDIGAETRTVKEKMVTTADLTEWNYGMYEGLTPREIRTSRKERGLDQERGWEIWRDGCEDGESPEQVSARLDAFIERIREPHRRILGGEAVEASGGGDVLLIAHGHILRAFAKRWLGFPLEFPLSMILEPGGVGILSYDHHTVDEPAVLLGMAFPTKQTGS
ncbi:MAG: hypothetical protein M1837_003576 [Sclerophora amabilis]|nr:MAG: hypothetical protein M1837_003576 [Sclerophora amabilis]